MTGRLDTRRPRPATPPAAASPAIRRGPVAGPGSPAQLGPVTGLGPHGAAADPAHPRCERGGLDAVINGSDLATAASHLSECMACQAQFLSQGGLLPVPERATARRADEPAEHTAPARP